MKPTLELGKVINLNGRLYLTVPLITGPHYCSNCDISAERDNMCGFVHCPMGPRLMLKRMPAISPNGGDI